MRYASLIKKGLHVPHPCLNQKFQDLLLNNGYSETK